MIDPTVAQPIASAPFPWMQSVLIVLSWVLNTAGVGVGIAGYIYARQQGRKAKTAEELVTKVKRDLYHQKASQVFNQMSTASSSLTTSIRGEDWHKAMDSLISLGGQIANAIGAFPELIGEKGAASLQTCATELARMFDTMPIANPSASSPETIKLLIVASVNVDFRLQTIAGQMRLAIELENPNDRISETSGEHQSRNEADATNNAENGTAEADVEGDADGI